MTGQDLKNSILQLAIQGKLVAQDANDEPASVLLERIKAEKKKLIEEKKIKKEKPLPEITDEEKPFEIPDSWVWVRISEFALVARGGSPRPIKDYLTESNDGINWIKIGDTEKGGKYINSCAEKIKPSGVSKSRIVHAGDFLLTNSMSFGRPYITNVEGCIHDGWLVISQYLQTYSQDFFFYLLSSPFAYSQFCEKTAGAVVQNLNKDKVAESVFPLPPLSEQKRIVTKIEELMPLVDEYDKAQKELDSLNSAMPEQLKQSLLQEAIMGKLGTNNPDDEPAAQLIKDKKIKKEKPLPEITDEEKTFDIPDNWVWCRIPEIGTSQLGKTKNPNQTKGILQKYLCSINVYWNKIDLGNVKEMLFDKDEIDKYQIKKGDLLICEGGDCGRSAIWDLEDNICYQNALHRVRFYCGINPFYIYYCLFSFYKNGTLDDYIKGETIKHLVKGKLDSILFPLPPLAEQHRIVSKIENLFACIEPLAKDLK